MRNFIQIAVLISLLFVVRDFVQSKSLLGESQEDLKQTFHRGVEQIKTWLSFADKNDPNPTAISSTSTTMTTNTLPKISDMEAQKIRSELKNLSDSWRDPKQKLESKIPIPSLFQAQPAHCSRTYTQFLIRAAEDLGPDHGLAKDPESGQAFMKARAKETCPGVPERDFDLQLHFDCRNSESFQRSKNLKDCKTTYQFLSQRVSCVSAVKAPLSIQWDFDPNLKLQTATELSKDPTVSARIKLGEVASGPCAGRILYQRDWRYHGESFSIRYLVSARSEDLIVLGQWMPGPARAYEIFASFQAPPESPRNANWFGLSPAQQIGVTESVGMKTNRRVFMDLTSEMAPELNPPDTIELKGRNLKISKNFINAQSDFPEILQRTKKASDKEPTEIYQFIDMPTKFLVKHKSFYYPAE